MLGAWSWMFAAVRQLRLPKIHSDLMVGLRPSNLRTGPRGGTGLFMVFGVPELADQVLRPVGSWRMRSCLAGHLWTCIRRVLGRRVPYVCTPSGSLFGFHLPPLRLFGGWHLWDRLIYMYSDIFYSNQTIINYNSTYTSHHNLHGKFFACVPLYLLLIAVPAANPEQEQLDAAQKNKR